MTSVKLTPAELRLLDIQKAQGIHFPDHIFVWREANATAIAALEPDASAGRAMSATSQVPDPAAVAWWLRMLKIHTEGCIKPVPDPADPLAVAAYNQARRQLAAEAAARAKAEAHAEPEATP
jgi:hypothetical protein